MFVENTDYAGVSALFRSFAETGDVSALEAVFRSVHPWLFRVIYRITGDRDAANDVHQETWMKVLTNPERFDERRGSFQNYIFTIAKNDALKWKVSSKRFIRLRSDHEERMRDNNFQEEGKEARERIRRTEMLRKEIRALPPKFQNVILLHYFAMMEVKQIAAILECPDGTVKTWLDRARKLLAKKLHKYDLF